jgi:hypothetical protein
MDTLDVFGLSQAAKESPIMRACYTELVKGTTLLPLRI